MSGIASVQLSFLVEREVFAWWGGADPAASAAGLGLTTEVEQVRIARPVDDEVHADALAAALSAAGSTLAALAAAGPAADWGRSVHAWREVAGRVGADGGPVPETEELDRLAALLPVAAHAGVGGDGTTIWSARATLQAAARTARSDRDAPTGLWQVLRPYQRAGARWLGDRLDEAGGALLADEMGLGKTVQTIAVLAARPGPALVVCPASLVGTWQRELARFAPELSVVGPTDRSLGERTVALATYGSLARGDALGRVEWDTVVLDEAQFVKNPVTATARRARALSARGRIALTGTPVENRLDDLWSLLAFNTPEVLGPRARFRRRFAALSGHGQRERSAAAQRLSALVGQHVLRRRKAEVAAELPARLDLVHEVEATDEQQRLYRDTLDGALGLGLGTGTERRGRVLALLTRLKQLCVHPALAGGGVHGLAGRSGSWDRLTELVGEIVDNGEAALVFTQYREAGMLLARHLRDEVTGAGVPFLHGGLSRPTRERLVSDFSADGGPPVLVLSLRAAGTGLTLTRATHVLHLDRWWNPAVEAQASDRAHRIGQTRTVTVHTFTTRGTVEALIADLHRGKVGLAEAVRGDGDATVGALARLGDDELRAALDRAG